MKRILPDYNIHIGIKDKKVVCVDFQEVLKNEPHLSYDEIRRMVIDCLRDSVKEME